MIAETRVSVEQADLDKLLSDVDRYLHDKCADPVADELHTRLHEVAFALASSNRSEGEVRSDPYSDGYAEGQRNALAEREWMQDKAWMDAVLMLVHYRTEAERVWLVGHEQAAAKLAQAWKDAEALAWTKSADDIAALTARPDGETVGVQAADPCDLAGHLGHEAAAIKPALLLSSKVELLPSAREAMLESMASPTTNAGGERENEPVGNSDELARLREALEACRDQFAFYAREHGLAGKHEKRETNQRFVNICSTALATKGGAE